MTTALEFKDVDILFTRESGRASRARLLEATQQLDVGHSRADILKSTGVVVGVAGANLTVRTGDISVLMGLSGSGKSTLLRAANGLNPVTRGDVWVSHRGEKVNVARCDMTTLREIRRGGVAMMFQQFGLLPWRTVRDNVGLGLELRGESADQRRQRVDEKLELVGLTQWAEHDVSELSGGMQQRVGLARAFATDADILLMDEPFSALDPLIRTKLQDELVALQRTLRKTILFVTHDLDEALRIGDRISVLDGGRIVQTGTPEDIVLRPQGTYVTEFVRHMNPLTVLRGHMVMTPVAAPDGIAGPYRLAGRYQGVWGACGELAVSNDDGPVELPCAPIDTPLRTLIALQQSSGHPVLLLDGHRIVGICTPDDVVRALASGHGAVKQASDAN